MDNNEILRNVDFDGKRSKNGDFHPFFRSNFMDFDRRIQL